MRPALRPPSRRSAALGLGLLAALVACGGEELRLDPAAEPARSPELAREPAGEVQELPSQSEGLAFDERTGTLAYASFQPGRVTLRDVDTGTDRAVVDVPGDPGRQRHLSLTRDSRTLLVSDEGGDVLVTVDVESGEETGTIAVGDFPHDAQEDDAGRVWVGNEGVKTGIGSLSVVQDGEEVALLTENLTQPGGVLIAGGRVGAIDVRRNALVLFDAESQEHVASLNAGTGPTHGVVDRDGRMVVVDTEGDQVLVYRVEPFALVQRAPLRGSPYGVDYDPERHELVATLTARNEVVVVALDGPQPRVVERYPTVRQPNTVAVDSRDGTLYVAGSVTGVGELQVIERPEAG